MEKIGRSHWLGLDYRGWIGHFQRNESCRLRMGDRTGGSLTERERRLLAPSIRAFHRGERSEGKHLMQAAEEFAAGFGEADYPEAIRLFIREENRHSAYLGDFMKREGIAFAGKSCLDDLFTCLRSRGGILGEVVTLVTAEIVALSYYSALADASGSEELRRICGQMVHDEIPHIVFQSYTLSHFRQSPGLHICRRLLMEGTGLAVYLAFFSLFRETGWSYGRLREENLAYLTQSERLAAFFYRERLKKKRRSELG